MPVRRMHAAGFTLHARAIRKAARPLMERRRMIRPLLIALVLACGAASAQDAALPNTSVQSLDLQRYAGQWHEIARLPMFFQRNCAANVTATYTPRADGKVGVRNACDDKEGESMVSEGVARPVAGQPGQLEVRFAPDWLAWAPMTWADYWVVELDPAYQWAVVGGPSRQYLWVLSRTPTMPRAQFDAIRERAARRGYPVDRLLVSPNGMGDG
jgi:apolipoprotein D and lipocalin family protein